LKKFKWSSSYSVYVPEVDAEHRQLYRMAEDLKLAILAEEKLDHSRPLLGEFARHVTAHFGHEERLMKATNYPSKEWHKGQHGTASRKLAVLKRALERGESAAGLEILAELHEWLQNHIRLADRMLGAHLRAYSRLRSAIAS